MFVLNGLLNALLNYHQGFIKLDLSLLLAEGLVNLQRTVNLAKQQLEENMLAVYPNPINK